MTESALKTAIVKHLRASGIICWRAGAGPYSTPGVADICGTMPGGRSIYVEAKRPGRYKNAADGLTPLQLKWLSRMKAQGALVIVTDNLATVRKILELVLR